MTRDINLIVRHYSTLERKISEGNKLICTCVLKIIKCIKYDTVIK